MQHYITYRTRYVVGIVSWFVGGPKNTRQEVANMIQCMWKGYAVLLGMEIQDDRKFSTGYL